MPIPRRVGQWNKVGLNRLTRHIAPWMPGFGVVVHRGRRSGRRVSVLVSLTGTGGGPSLHIATTAPARRLHGRRLAWR